MSGMNAITARLIYPGSDLPHIKINGKCGPPADRFKIIDTCNLLRGFIESYKEDQCIWKIKSKVYLDKNKKKSVYYILINKLKELDQDTNKDAVVILLFSVAALSSLTTTVLEIVDSFY